MNKRLLFAAVIALAAIFTVSHRADAQATPAAPAPASAPAVAQPVPDAPPADPVPAQPEQAPAAVRREEEESVEAPVPGQSAPARPNVFQRAQVYLQDRKQLANTLAAQAGEIEQLRGKIADAENKLLQKDAELADLRKGRDDLQQAIDALEKKSGDVVDQLATLGFPAAQLPPTQSIEQAAEHSPEGLADAMRRESDPVKQAALRQKLIALNASKKNPAPGLN